MTIFELNSDEYIIFYSSKNNNDITHIYATSKFINTTKKWYYKYFNGNIITLYPYIEIHNNTIIKYYSNERIDDFINYIKLLNLKEVIYNDYELHHNITILEHEYKVNYIKNNYKKVVLSRKTDVDLKETPDMNMIYYILKKENCYNVLFMNNKTIWISNTPESLFKRKNNKIIIDSIGGTISKVQDNKENEKNKAFLLNNTKLINEQKIITDWFCEQLKNINNNIKIDPISIIDCNYVYHRKTSIEVEINDNILDIDLINKLHPSPAICGYPYEESKNIINSIESYDRQLYTGCLGYCDEEKKTSEYVIMIRICSYDYYNKNNSIISLYTGGGIVKDSNPNDEWDELNNKLLFFAPCLKNMNNYLYWYNIRNINQIHSKAIMQEFKNHGIDYVCLSPGYRSSNLAIMAKQTKMKTMVTYDERSMAFHAIGYSKANLKPAIIITTSGTAVGNIYPAILEAYYSNTPLIICTADRPKKLHCTDSNQTIDQNNFFFKHTHWSFDLPKPENNIESIRLWLSTVSYASYLANNNSAIIHLNMQYDNPLYPKLENWNKNIIKYNYLNKYIDYIDEIKNIKNGLVLVGKVKNNNFMKETRIPIILDISYGNLYNLESYNIIENGELFIEKYFDILIQRVETLIIYGDHFVSKTYSKFISEFNTKIIWVVNNDLQVDENRLSKKITKNPVIGEGINIEDLLPITVLNPTSIFYNNIFENITDELLFISNSSPIRDINRYTKWYKLPCLIYSNRGCSGIDGIISTVIGISNGKKSPCILIIGDMSFCHDINGLNMIKKNKYPIKIICLNNQGGKIFERLPLKSNISKACFDELFIVNPNVNMKDIAKAFDIDYLLVNNNEKFMINNFNKSIIIEIIL